MESSASEGPHPIGFLYKSNLFCLLFIEMALLVSDGNGVISYAFAVKGKQAAREQQEVKKT